MLWCGDRPGCRTSLRKSQSPNIPGPGLLAAPPKIASPPLRYVLARVAKARPRLIASIALMRASRTGVGTTPEFKSHAAGARRSQPCGGRAGHGGCWRPPEGRSRAFRPTPPLGAPRRSKTQRTASLLLPLRFPGHQAGKRRARSCGCVYLTGVPFGMMPMGLSRAIDQ
jgi:hypothetical protein